MNLSRPHTLVLALAALLVCAVMASPASASSSRYEKRASFSLEGPAGHHKSKAKSSDACGETDAKAGTVADRELASATVCLLNRERTSRGLRSLSVNNRLSAAAQRHTNDMVRRRYFAHESRSDGSTVDRIRGAGYLSGARSWMIGENLAWGSGSKGTPRQIVVAWMNSPGHRRNILTGRFREIGIGVQPAAPTGSFSSAATYTTTFGQRG
jgi:uncharacterized protein YkwD